MKKSGYLFLGGIGGAIGACVLSRLVVSALLLDAPYIPILADTLTIVGLVLGIALGYKLWASQQAKKTVYLLIGGIGGAIAGDVLGFLVLSALSVLVSFSPEAADFFQPIEGRVGAPYTGVVHLTLIILGSILGVALGYRLWASQQVGKATYLLIGAVGGAVGGLVLALLAALALVGIMLSPDVASFLQLERLLDGPYGGVLLSSLMIFGVILGMASGYMFWASQRAKKP